MYLKSKKVSPSWHSNFLFLFTNYLMIDLYVIVINCVSNVFFTNIISILPKIIKVNKTEVLSPNIRTQQSHRQKLKKRKLMLIHQYIVHHNSKVCWLFLVLLYPPIYLHVSLKLLPLHLCSCFVGGNNEERKSNDEESENEYLEFVSFHWSLWEYYN